MSTIWDATVDQEIDFDSSENEIDERALTVAHNDDGNLATLEDAYFVDIIGCAPLPRKQERALFVEKQELEMRCENSQDTAEQLEIEQRLETIQNLIIKSNLRFVVSIAKEHQGRGLSLIDLISLGNLGLLVSYERFDHKRGFKFITYAVWWIRQAIQRGLLYEGRTIRLAPSVIDRAKAFLRMVRDIEQEENEGCNIWNSFDKIQAYIAKDKALRKKFAGLTEKRFREILIQAQKTTSLNAPAFEFDDSNVDLLDCIASEDPTPVESAEAVNRSLITEQLLQKLDRRERYVVECRFGLNERKPMTLEQIGASMRLTRERARQLEERAILKMRFAAQGFNREEIFNGN